MGLKKAEPVDLCSPTSPSFNLFIHSQGVLGGSAAVRVCVSPHGVIASAWPGGGVLGGSAASFAEAPRAVTAKAPCGVKQV